MKNLKKRQASLERRDANIAFHNVNKIQIKEDTVAIKRTLKNKRERYFEDDLLQKQAFFEAA